MGPLTTADRALPQAIPNHGTAKKLGADQRQRLAVPALAGHQTISGLAAEAGVSRQFVYQQAGRAQTALGDAFAPTEDDDTVLFQLRSPSIGSNKPLSP